MVVIDNEGKTVGYVSKTNLVSAHKTGVKLNDKVGLVLVVTKDLRSILDTDSRDDAADAFAKSKYHHAIVQNKEGEELVGLISTWDVVDQECAGDSKAWPWSRTEDGRLPQQHLFGHKCIWVVLHS
jgi:CBS-domain-containing membrane protein